MQHPRCVLCKLGGGWYVKHNCLCISFIRLTTCFGTVGHLQVTKMYNEEKLYSVRSLVVVHILNFQHLVIVRFIRIELITCSTSKVDRIKVHIQVVRDIT